MVYCIPKDTLAHHGIKGQHWGVKNGPPYPLGSEQHSVSEKKAAQNGHSGGLTAGQKKVIIAGVVAASAAVATAYLIKSGKAAAMVQAGKSALASLANSENIQGVGQNIRAECKKYGIKYDAKLTEKSLSAIQDAAKKANPTGDSHNCIKTSITWCLERHGIAVTAKPGRGFSKQIFDIFPNAEHEFVLSDTRDIKDAVNKACDQILKEHPEGSFGVLWGNTGARGSGHCIGWEIINGKIQLVETQTGKLYNGVSGYMNKVAIPKNLNKDSISFADLSNTDIAFDIIKEICNG